MENVHNTKEASENNWICYTGVWVKSQFQRKWFESLWCDQHTILWEKDKSNALDFNTLPQLVQAFLEWIDLNLNRVI